ncbi:MAG TPA: ribonuclease P protein component [Chitinophagaceae bacterium]|nr:ribonuclease P protein component [Chitinophagaceae bacterium]
MAKQFTLGKKERLKSRKQTELLFSEGKKFSVYPFRICYTRSRTGMAGTRFGVGVSTKLFKKAVDRNRVKRLVREAWRLQKRSFQEQLKEQGSGMDVFFIYTSKELPLYKDVYEKTGKVLLKLSQLSAETT